MALAIDDFAAFAKIQTKKIKIATIILTIFILSVIAQAFLNINPGNSTGYPYEAAKFLKSANLPNGNFLNPYGWGGYLIWQNPEIPVFIDGRGPQLKINPKTTILQEENQFYSNDTAVIQEKLDHYNIGFVLTQKPIDKQHNFIDRFFWQMKGATTKTVEQHKNNLDNYLLSSPNWSLVYEDDISRVYFRQQ
ncbi:MAG: hypothetical protein BWY19_01230 [bacterium ADurb.Bin212]|nr:MAG: hypothetical protein BWY19_01230 [bacterium ADurb.Bin212]